MNKPLRILCGRSGMLGDTVGALVIANHFRKLYPESHLIWPIGKRFAHASPIYLNQGVINEIFIFDGAEKPESKRDWDMINSCDIKINPTPDHRFETDWPNYRNFYEETFTMGGLSMDQYNSLSEEEKYPKLYKWFRDEPLPFSTKDKKVIAIWGFAGYAKEPKRSPSKQWYDKLVSKICDDYVICQFGHENDPIIEDTERFNDLDFFQQIRMTLSTDLVLSTDSGSGLIFAAYGHKQINCVSQHWPNHTKNPLALAPIGKNTYNFFGEGGCDNISIDKVVAKIVELSS